MVAVTNIVEKDRNLENLIASQGAMPAELESAKSALVAAREAFEEARRNHRAASARHEINLLPASAAKQAEMIMEDAGDELQRAEDRVAILTEKAQILDQAIDEAKAQRRAKVLPEIRAEGEKVVAAAAKVLELLKVLVVDARRVNAAVEDEYLLGMTTHGFSRWSKETKELGNVPAVAALLSSRSFAGFVEEFERSLKG